MRRATLPTLIVLAAASALACQEAPTPVGLDGPNPAFNRGKGGGGGGGGGGGAGALFDLTITGALEASASGIALLKDDNRRVRAPISMGQWKLVSTHAAAQLEMDDPSADDACSFDPPDMADEYKQTLVDAFVARGSGAKGDPDGGWMNVNKKDMRGQIRVDPGFFFMLGASDDNPGDPRAFVDDNGSGVDWNDAGSTRAFRFTGGRFRATTRIPDGTGESTAGLVCENQGDVIVGIVAPAS